MIYSPRDNFRRSPDIAGWADQMASDRFQNGVSAAMLTFVSELPYAKNWKEAAANHYRVQGAHRFMHALLNLGEHKLEVGPKVQSSNLQHKV